MSHEFVSLAIKQPGTERCPAAQTVCTRMFESNHEPECLNNIDRMIETLSNLFYPFKYQIFQTLTAHEIKQ